MTRAPERTLVARGLGRSYGDSAMNGGGGVILTERLSRLLAFDPEAAWIECEAGLSLRSLLAFLVPRGLFLPVVPGTQFVTVGGAIAADVHGKNQHLDGTFGRHVIEIRLMVPSGEILRCAPDENADVFDATLGGMGLTGTVVSARLKLLPVESAFVATSIRRAPDLATTLAAIEEDARSSRYSVAWIDGLARGAKLGRAVLIRGDHLPAGDLPLRHRARPLRSDASRALTVPFDLPGFALGPATVGAFNGLYFNTARTGTSVSTIEQFFFPLDRALHWNRLYGRRGFVQYQALLPRETAAEGCARILEEISRIRAASFLAVLKTTGPAGRGLLSFPLPGITLALDIPNVGEPLRPLARRLDEIVLGASGRLYLAKDALTDAPTFAAMYPRLGAFRAIRRRVDPSGRLGSSQSRRLGLSEGP
jgi:decaprenylphospho-beta-D-ribofuranose 2-oxidase